MNWVEISYVLFVCDGIIIYERTVKYNMIHLLLGIIYLAFISLGLPDALLGAAWPTMYTEFGIPVSYAGIISMIISVGTIVSSLQSDIVTLKLGTGKVTVISVAMTAAALLGFSGSHSFFALCLWAIPYGLGAGSVDAALNNYVALNFASRHMSWLHCMWGVGASVGPYIMGYALLGGAGWNGGYLYIAILQIILTVILIMTLPLWKTQSIENKDHIETISKRKAITFSEITNILGIKEVLIVCFCYCAMEQTAGLWASSYLTIHNGLLPEKAAGFASIFFIGITVGRGLSGFLTIRFSNPNMIRLGQVIAALGIVIMLLPLGNCISLLGLIFIGLGCAPIYPCIIHSTPTHFGEDKSQAIIGVQMASAYIGTCLMPPLFGLVAEYITVSLLPIYLSGLLVVMIFMHESLLKKTHAYKTKRRIRYVNKI